MIARLMPLGVPGDEGFREPCHGVIFRRLRASDNLLVGHGAYPRPCHCRIASTGQNSMTTLSVRLSRMIQSVSSSNAIASARLTHAGTRAAKRKPAIIQPISAAELTIESPL